MGKGNGARPESGDGLPGILPVVSDLQFPEESVRYPEESKALTALILSIIGLVMSVTFLGIIGLVMAIGEIRAIEEGRRPPEGLQMAKTARTLGIVSCVLVALSLILTLFLLGNGFF